MEGGEELSKEDLFGFKYAAIAHHFKRIIEVLFPFFIFVTEYLCEWASWNKWPKSETLDVRFYKREMRNWCHLKTERILFMVTHHTVYPCHTHKFFPAPKLFPQMFFFFIFKKSQLLDTMFSLHFLHNELASPKYGKIEKISVYCNWNWQFFT